jgi:hypothetical protein
MKITAVCLVAIRGQASKSSLSAVKSRVLKILRLRLSDNLGVGSREVFAIAGALKENKGLVDLDLMDAIRMGDETWFAVCDSLKIHPTLEVLNLCLMQTLGGAASAVLKSRIQTLLDLLKVNTSIHTITSIHYNEHELFRKSIIPYLETNRLRPRLLAIQRSRPIAYRVKVLGRALLAVRTDPNRFWMLLSGNTEVAVPSTTANTTNSTSFPAPAAAVAANSSTTATSNVIAPVSGQKRKACP